MPIEIGGSSKPKKKGPAWMDRVKGSAGGTVPKGAYGGTYNPTATNPALPPRRAPAYGGTYNPTPTTQSVAGASNSAVVAPAWWQQMAQGYANQASAYQASGGGQPPEGNLSDFYFRHPDKPTTPATPPTLAGGGYSGYGYSKYRRRGGGGGRGGGYSYAPRPQSTYADSGPAWARGLANWSIG